MRARMSHLYAQVLQFAFDFGIVVCAKESIRLYEKEHSVHSCRIRASFSCV